MITSSRHRNDKVRLFHSVAADDMATSDTALPTAGTRKWQATQSLNAVLAVFDLFVLCLFLFAQPAPTIGSLWFIPVTGMVLHMTAFVLARKQGAH